MFKKILVGLMVLGLFTACSDKEEKKVESVETKVEMKTEVKVKEVEKKTEVMPTVVVEKKAEKVILKKVEMKTEVKAVEEMKTVVEEKAVEIKTKVEEKTVELKTIVEEKKAEVKVIEKKVTKIDPALLFKACASCHGAKGDKKALGQSALIGTWSADKIAAALVGYKDGTYGKAMKGLMKAQVNKLSDEEIKSISKYISTLNK